MREAVGLVGAGVIAASAIYYFLDVLRGDTRPQRSSWLVWAVVGMLGFGTADAGGAGAGAWAAGVDAVACVATYTVSLLPRYGKPGGRRTDVALAAVAVAGVALWRSGVLPLGWAAVSAVAFEIPALWPTLREAWRQPYAEPPISWGVDVVGHALAVVAVAHVSLAALAYPVYLVLAHAAVAVVLVVRTGQVRPAQLELARVR